MKSSSMGIVFLSVLIAFGATASLIGCGDAPGLFADGKNDLYLYEDVSELNDGKALEEVTEVPDVGRNAIDKEFIMEETLGTESDISGCVIPRSDYVGLITLHSGYWGNWQSCTEFCPSGTFAYKIAVRSEGPQGSGDDTAQNGVVLYCFDRTSGAYRGYVTSHPGYWGSWGSVESCLWTSNPIVGGKMKVEPPQGSGDDTAANRTYAYCKNKQLLAPSAQTAWGNWYSPRYCGAGQAVCGIRTRVEPSLGSGGDDTALNGVQFACCYF